VATFIRAAEELAELHFPLAGINVSIPFERSPATQLPPGEWSKGTPVAVNVRGYDRGNRLRGAVRPGLSRQVAAAVPGGLTVQDVIGMTGQGYAPPGGSVQQSQSGRVVTLVAVSKGKVYAAAAGDTAWTPAVNGSSGEPPLNPSGQVFSAANNQKLWFADGKNFRYYDPSLNTVKNWTTAAAGTTTGHTSLPGPPAAGTGTSAGGGTLPRDTQGNAPRLICTWRGRTVLSGLLGDPQNWFMSALGDPPTSTTSRRTSPRPRPSPATTARSGLVGDVVTCLVPYTDDVLLIGGDHDALRRQGRPDGRRPDRPRHRHDRHGLGQPVVQGPRGQRLLRQQPHRPSTHAPGPAAAADQPAPSSSCSRTTTPAPTRSG
jgi:hypothetical protein